MFKGCIDSTSKEVDRRFMIKLPFISKAGKLFAKNLTNLIAKQFDVKIMVVYKSCKLSSFFFIKGCNPTTLINFQSRV